MTIIASSANDGDYSNDTGTGAFGWSNTDNLNTDDTNITEPSNQSGGVCIGIWWGFSFSGLQSGDTINDVKIRIRALDSYGDAGWYLNIEWIDSATTDSTDFIGTVTRLPASGDFTDDTTNVITQVRTLQGTLPTAAELLGNFRIMLSRAGDTFEEDTDVRYMEVEVDYTAAGGPSGNPWDYYAQQ